MCGKHLAAPAEKEIDFIQDGGQNRIINEFPRHKHKVQNQ
jgi:hypothetical protein